MLKNYKIGSWSHKWAMVVAQLVERSLLTAVICGSNPSIKIMICIFVDRSAKTKKENIP